MTKKSADSLEHLFEHCILMTLKDRFSNNDPFGLFYGDDGNHLKTYRKVIASPQSFGIVGSHDLWAMHDAAFKAALAFGLGLIPEGIDLVLCFDSKYLSPENIREAENLGITVLIDDTGYASNPLIPEDAFNAYDPEDPFWKTVSEETRTFLSFWRESRKNRAVKSTLEEGFESKEDWMCEGSELARLIEKLSFGNVKWNPACLETERQMPDWVLRKAEGYLFTKRDSYADEAFTKVLETLENVCWIWNARLTDSSLFFKPSRGLSEDPLSVLSDIGRALGVDRDIEAYFAGVPAEDILAA